MKAWIWKCDLCKAESKPSGMPVGWAAVTIKRTRATQNKSPWHPSVESLVDDLDICDACADELDKFLKRKKAG